VRPARSSHEEEVWILVVIAIEQGDAAPHGFWQKLLPAGAMVMDESDPGPGGHIVEENAGQGGILQRQIFPPPVHSLAALPEKHAQDNHGQRGEHHHGPEQGTVPDQFFAGGGLGILEGRRVHRGEWMAGEGSRAGRRIRGSPIRHGWEQTAGGVASLIQRMRERAVEGLFIFAFWTFLGLSFAGQFFIASSQLNRPVSWQQALFHSLTDWYVFALLSVFPIVLARRYGFGHRHWWRHIVLHAGASVIFSLSYVVVRTAAALLLAMLASQPASFAETFRPLLFKTWHFNLLIYWVILTAYHALDFYRKYQERHSRSLQLEKSLVEARLQALQMQFNPHFLYNTLHAISSLMYRDVEAADRMIAQLSDLLRYALDSTSQQEVPLRRDLEFLSNYLKIEQTRFGDRLQIEMEIQPETEELLVPTLILQPLIENAIRHGIEPHARPGSIRIRTERAGDTLTLRVQDSGLGPAQLPFKDGVGLSNTRARLEQLYGPAHTFSLAPGQNGGLEARLTLPCRKVAQSQSSR